MLKKNIKTTNADARFFFFFFFFSSFFFPFETKGITCNIACKSQICTTFQDATCVLVPGQIIKIGQHILNVGKLGTKGIDNSHFNSTGFTLEQKFEHTSIDKGTIEIRRHEVQISKIRLHDALRSLGQSIKLDETVNYMKTIETQ